jgi:hypothetical protein
MQNVFKNVAGSLTSGHRFYLDQRTVEAYKLPNNETSLVPITQVFELEKGDVLKLCPRLKVNVITPNHFEKMNTSLSVALLSHDVAAAILYQNSVKNIEAKHQTTAWFLMLMQKWLKLITSRSQNMARSNANPKEHDAAIRFFHTFMQIVRTLKTIPGGLSPVHPSSIGPPKYISCWSGRSNLVYDAGAAFNISADNYLMCRYVGGLSHNWESPDIWLIFIFCKRPPAYYLPPLIERGKEFTFVRFC